MNRYYTGVNFSNISNKSVNVIEELYKFGTNKIPVYLCSDSEGNTYKILGTNLSETPDLNNKIISWGLQVCFPENVLRFNSFTPRGKYIADVQ